MFSSFTFILSDDASRYSISFSNSSAENISLTFDSKKNAFWQGTEEFLL